MDVGDEVRHLVVYQVESVELTLESGLQPPESLLVGHGYPPRLAERVLDLLEFQHEGEDSPVAAHDLLREDGWQRRHRVRFGHLVVEQEGLPAAVLVLGLQQVDIESGDELLVVELGVARADGGVQVGTHRVFVDFAGWLL